MTSSGVAVQLAKDEGFKNIEACTKPVAGISPSIDLLQPLGPSSHGSEAFLSTITAEGGKFDTFVMPVGNMDDFLKGLSSRIGFPHLQFLKTMEAEHTSMAGCEMKFTTRNYGITTTANTEWGIVVRGQMPPPEHMLHGRIIVHAREKLLGAQARKARLRLEEVIALVLYTGPMFMIYNCVLSRWSKPATMWDTLREGNNLFATTLSVLVSAVQKLSAVSVIPDGLKLYRGTGGLVYLPEHFTKPDEFNCRGMCEFGFLSASSDKNVAIGYSGAVEGRPHVMVLEIEAGYTDRGAVVREFSQYPDECETLFLPMSYVAPSGERRVETTEFGNVTVIPVRLSLNMKADQLEHLEDKKKMIHLTSFEFRVNELRHTLQALANQGDADARLKKDRERQGVHWKREHSVQSYIEAQVKKVETVLARHHDRPAMDYSDDVVYRSLVSESLEAAQMAASALLWWMQDQEQNIHVIQNYPLLLAHRRFESFLKLRYSCTETEGDRHTAAVDLCRSRSLMRVDANERDDNGETRLIALVARGKSVEDARLLVAARANVASVDEAGRSALFCAAQQGHSELIGELACAGADSNQIDGGGSTPLWIASLNGHVKCVKALLWRGADLNKAMPDDDTTPLYQACQNGHPHVVSLLLRHGADVNRAKNTGATPLFVASQNGHRHVVDLLLCGHADVNKARNDGATPLLAAQNSGHVNITDALLHACPSPSLSLPSGASFASNAYVSQFVPANCQPRMLPSSQLGPNAQQKHFLQPGSFSQPAGSQFDPPQPWRASGASFHFVPTVGLPVCAGFVTPAANQFAAQPMSSQFVPPPPGLQGQGASCWF